MTTLREHVRTHTAKLLQKLVAQVKLAAVQGDEDAVHDLRVSIRRLRECLRTFEGLYPERPRKRIRKQLQRVMKSAERVRSADIALGLLRKSGLGEADPLIGEIAAQRVRSESRLIEELKALDNRPFGNAWHEELGL